MKNKKTSDIEYTTGGIGYTEEGWKKRISSFVDAFVQTPTGKKMQSYIDSKVAQVKLPEVLSREHDLLISKTLDTFTDINEKDLIGKKDGGYRQLPEYEKEYSSAMRLFESLSYSTSITKSKDEYLVTLDSIVSCDKNLLVALKKAFILKSQEIQSSIKK